MKRTIMGLAAVALLLSSCSKNEITDNGGGGAGNDPSIIGFNIHTGSRAVDSNLKLIEDDANGITVYAQHTKTTLEDRFTAAYTYTAATAAWTWPTANPDLYKWPAEAGTADLGGFPMQFASLYPDATITTGTAAIEIAPLVGDQKDYIAANSGSIAQKPQTGNVSLAFKHILSKIQFSITAGQKNTVNVQSVKVVNVQNQTATTPKPGYSFIDNAWSNPITVANTISDYVSYSYRNYAATDGVTGYTTAQAFIGADAVGGSTAAVAGNSGALMLMPQYGTTAWDDVAFRAAAKVVTDKNMQDNVATATAMGNWITQASPAGMKDNAAWQGARIEVVYNVTDGTNYLIGDANQFIRVGYALKLVQATPWAPGKMYTYIISLGSDDASGGILLDPFLYDNTGTATTDPIKPIGVNPGDPINNTSGVIGFKVSVADWGTSEDTSIK